MSERIRALSEQIDAALVRTLPFKSANHPSHEASAPGAIDYRDELVVHGEELAVAQEELHAQCEELALVRSALEDEHQKFFDLFHRAPDPYVVTDTRGMIAEANGAALTLFNVPRRTALGKPLINFVARRDTRAFRTTLIALGDGEEIAPFRMRFRPRQGAVVAAGVAARCLVQSGGDVTVRWILRVDRAEDRALRLARSARAAVGAAIDLTKSFAASADGDLRTQAMLAEIVAQTTAAASDLASLIDVAGIDALADADVSDDADPTLEDELTR